MLQQQPTWRNNTWQIDIFFLVIVLGALFFILLGTRPLFVPDEGRYAEIAREMVASRDYVTPYLNGVKYFEKPILFYWLTSTAIKITGLTLWSIRSVNAFLALLGCLATYFTARTLYDRATGLLAALILGTSTLYFVMAHMISLDLPVTVFLTISLYAFLLATQPTSKQKRHTYFYMFTAFVALAVLTKGLIGLLFPALIIGTWTILVGQWEIEKKSFFICLFIFLGITLPWHILVQLRNPEFFYFYFIEQHFLRYTHINVGHYQPIWFFIPNLILGFFPWIVFLPQTIAINLPSSWKARHNYSTEIFLFLWALLIFIFFSFSKSKLIPYILPIFPPLAILTARYLAQDFLEKSRTNMIINFFVSTLSSRGLSVGSRNIKQFISTCFLVLFSILIASTFYVYINNTVLPDPHRAKIYFYLAGTLLLLGNASVCISAYIKKIKQSILLLFITTGLFLLIILAGIPSIDTRTIQPLALSLKSLLKSQDDVITFNQYYQDLPFYLERRVSILNWRNELSNGMKYQTTSAWMMDDKSFWQRFHSKQRVFVFMSRESYQSFHHQYPRESIYLMAETTRDALLSNKKITLN